jgi:hypothetical protein
VQANLDKPWDWIRLSQNRFRLHCHTSA